MYSSKQLFGEIHSLYYSDISLEFGLFFFCFFFILFVCLFTEMHTASTHYEIQFFYLKFQWVRLPEKEFNMIVIVSG